MKEKSNIERKVERGLKQAGFKVAVLKQYQTKTVYEIEKDGTNERIEVPVYVTDVKKYIKMIAQDFENIVELNKLKKVLEQLKATKE